MMLVEKATGYCVAAEPRSSDTLVQRRYVEASIGGIADHQVVSDAFRAFQKTFKTSPSRVAMLYRAGPGHRFGSGFWEAQGGVSWKFRRWPYSDGAETSGGLPGHASQGATVRERPIVCGAAPWMAQNLYCRKGSSSVSSAVPSDHAIRSV